MYAGVELAFEDVVRMLNEAEGDIKANFTDQELQRLANRALDIITTRTHKGLDYQNKPFKDYSTKYAAKREKRGRNTDKVNLSFRGEMMAAITGGPDKGAARIYFSNSQLAEIANYHNSLEPRRKMPLRRFLDLDESTDDYQNLANMAADMIANRIDR
jgi:hypothetical protein